MIGGFFVRGAAWGWHEADIEWVLPSVIAGGGGG
jgi:hypothetical protein